MDDGVIFPSFPDFLFEKILFSSEPGIINCCSWQLKCKQEREWNRIIDTYSEIFYYEAVFESKVKLIANEILEYIVANKLFYCCISKYFYSH